MTDIRRHTPPDSRERESRNNWWTGTKRWTRYWYLRVMRQKSTPRQLAAALALGVFIGALPIMPLQSVVVIALAFLFKINKLAAWLATCYSNALTMAPFYYFLFKVGNAVMPFHGLTLDVNKLEMTQLIESGWDLYIVMFAGGLIVGIPATILTYFVSLKAIRAYRRRRALKVLRKSSGM